MLILIILRFYFAIQSETALTVDPSSATPYFHHVHPVVKFSEYPSGEALWLHNACVSAANRMQNMKYQGKAREWRELADSFIQCIHPNDRQCTIISNQT